MQEDREIRRFAGINHEVRKVGVDTAIHCGIFFATISFLTGMGVLAVWLFGGREVLLGGITLGTLMAFYGSSTFSVVHCGGDVEFTDGEVEHGD